MSMTSEQSNVSAEETKQSLPEKHDFSELKDRVTSIMRTVSGKPDLIVTTDISPSDIIAVMSLGRDARKAWYRREIVDPVTREYKGEYIHIPEKIFEANENIVKGKAAHEAGHVAISRMGRFIPDKVAQEPGFHQFIAAIEERPTDQVVRDRYAGAGSWVDEMRRDEANKGKVVAETKKDIGYIPKSIQMGNLIVFAPHFDNLPPIFSEDVVRMYDDVKARVEEVEHELPREGVTEKEITDSAKERYKIAYKKVWPEVKKLVEQDLKSEELRQMVNDMMRSQQNSGSAEEGNEDKKQDLSKEEGKTEENKNAMRQLMDALEDELKKELESAMSSLEELEQKAENGAQGDSDAGEKAGEEQEESEEENQQSTSSEASQGKEETGQPKETTEGKPSEFGIPVPMDKLSKKLLDALDRAFKSLPKPIQEELERRARKVLEAIEDRLVKEFQAKLDNMPLETHEEHYERVEKERKEVERSKEKAEIERELRDVERVQAALKENRNEYDTAYEAIRELDEKLYRELEEVFTPNIKHTMRLKSAGSKINLPAVFRWEAQRGAGTPSIDNRIFESTHLPEKKDYAFTLLNDLSGSMGGEKIQEDFKAKILLSEVLNRLGIRNEILGFQDEIIVFKKFDEEFTDDVRRRMSGMLKEVCNDNPGGHNRGDYNDDGPCLLAASKGFSKEPGKEKFLIVISDGLPDGRYSSDQDLIEAVDNILNTTDQKLIALGLGRGTEHVTRFYPTALPNITAHDLVETLGGLLKDMIDHPQRYSYRKK